MSAFVLLLASAFFAGLVDSAVGGGGLIQLPALLVFLPAELTRDLANVLGTNKASSIWGTGAAVLQYAPRIGVRWHSVLPAAVVAFAAAFAGSTVVSSIDRSWLAPVILVLLVGVGCYTLMRPSLGQLHAPAFSQEHERSLGLVMGALLGFYDGFFGPGMGSFLIFTFVGLFGFDFLRASAGAKVINFATNAAALIVFSATGHVLWQYALPMAACNVAGSVVGARLAIRGGNRFVRVLFLAVSSVLIVRFGWQVVGR